MGQSICGKAAVFAMGPASLRAPCGVAWRTLPATTFDVLVGCTSGREIDSCVPYTL